MLWDGNRQAQEYTDTHIFTTIYEQNSFVPVARLVWLKDELLQSANDEIINAERESWEPEPKLIPNVQIYHYHNDHLGTPNELTSQDGKVVWLADYEAWGNTAKVVYKEIQLHNTVVSANELQPLRFQGQSFDTETGLHYNRFRYFDPDLGMFVSRDPIGLMGGSNVFAYAPNPTGWVDPFGLLTVKQQQARALEQVTALRNTELLKTTGQQARVVNAIVTKEGNVILGINNRSKVSGIDSFLDISENTVKDRYDEVDSESRGSGHGNCAEVCSLNSAVERKKRLEGAVSIAMNVKTGQVIPACGSCDQVLASFGILDAVKSPGKLRY